MGLDDGSASVARQDRDTGRRIQAAYKAAWPHRGLGQDVSNSPLLDRLRAEGVEEALDEASPLHQIIIGFWRKGVHPRRLKWELMKSAGRAILQLGDTGLIIRDAFKGQVRLHESWDLPDGKAWRRFSGGGPAEHVAELRADRSP